MYKEIDLRLSDAAYTTGLIFGDDFHKNLPELKKISKDQNIKNSLLLSSITEKSDVIYVYTLIYKNKKAYFTSSSATKEEQNKNKYTPYMYRYKDASRKLKNSFSNHKTHYEVTTDEWGTFRSIIMPRVTANGEYYVVGADIEISYIEKELNKVLLEIILAFFVFIVILLPFIFRYNSLMKEEQKAELEKQKQLQEQSKLAQMGEMIGNISHQWRQPLCELNSVIMNLETDFEENRLDKKTLDKRISKIEDLTEHMSMTINDFNNFFKKEKIKEEFLISEAIDQALYICKNTCKQNGIKIKKEIIDDIKIKNFKNEFIQALIAIFQNAKDAMNTNNVQNPLLSIIVKKTDDRLIISIIDNGGGVDEKNISKIFEPYFTTKFKSSGVGIGLYMTKMIIEKNMKGKISVSNKDEGAEFEISLWIE